MTLFFEGDRFVFAAFRAGFFLEDMRKCNTMTQQAAVANETLPTGA